MKIKLSLFLLLIGANISMAQTAKEDFSDDWARLSKYQKENDSIGLPKKGEKRVVFLGSSIFEFWKQKDPEYFSKNAYVDRGISGQISPQLLIRFRQDVINLKPKAVIILAGSNDLAGNKGHVSNKTILDNVKTMTELARKHNIKVIVCKYLPVYEYPWNKNLKNVAAQIISLNEEIVAYAKKEHLTVLDYFTPLVDERNGQKAEYTTDGVHPNLAGYKVMEVVTNEAIRKTIGY
ncbi:GDSL-type esterase/lipase family protein [Pedobacter aquatilis]|uniref:GDSL-type esterase/lipase family protein n=1 Tax=Pedobacter aquatilis TaxID=351343 RepID=UPI0025B508D0|nr:GDSL-type esterase/lipase family protein [Pedobacter aquatilis]MDN3586758.1 GDSL-type esterase/lipase family protein [Pedobacter aquatilis]